MTDKNIVLIRQWWLCYFRLLQEGGSSLQLRLNDITKRLEKLGIIVSGTPMNRQGAEDLAEQCDELKARMFANATRKYVKP